MTPSDKSDLFRQQAVKTLKNVINDIRQKKYDSKLLRGYTLPMDETQLTEFFNAITSKTDDALKKLFSDDGEEETNILRPPSKNKKNGLQKSLANYAIVDDDALTLQLSVERHAKALHELTKEPFCLLSLRMEKLANRRLDVTQHPLHPILLWYTFREAYERLLPSKYDRKPALRYWTQLLTDDDWLHLLADGYKEWLNQLNQWLVSQSVLPNANNEDIRARFLRKEQARVQAQNIRNDVISTITGKTSESGTAPDTGEIYQQLSQLIKNYKPASAMAPHMITGNAKGAPLDQQTFANIIQQVDTHALSQMSSDAVTGYLQDNSTENLAQTLAQHSGVNKLAIDKRTQTTIALLSMVFDQLKSEENIADPIKALMSGLQLPVLDSALKDEGFFTDVDNAAQQLVGEFARVGTYWSPKAHADNDIIYKKMLSIVDDVQQHYHSEEDIFEHALQELLVFLDREEYKASLLSERVIEAEQARIRARQARELTQTLLAEYIGEHKLPLLTSKFISGHWQHVLFFNLNQNPDIHTDAMQRALQTLDQLIAAAKGDTSVDLYKLLVAIRNQLLENSSDFPERTEALRNLFLELKVIASAVTKNRSETRTQTLPEATKPEASSVAPLPLEDIVGAAVEMVSVDLPLAKKPEVEVKPAPIRDAYADIADNLHNNVWFKYQQGRNTIKIKLAVIMKHSDTYIFINNSGQKVFSDTHEGVTNLLRNGKLVPLAESAYFDRALQSVVTTLKK